MEDPNQEKGSKFGSRIEISNPKTSQRGLFRPKKRGQFRFLVDAGLPVLAASPVHTCTHMHTHAHTHAHTCTHIHTHIHTYLHTHRHTHTYTCTHTHTHTHVHTHHSTPTHTLVNTTPQLTRFRGAKVCSEWLQERIDEHNIQSDYKCTIRLKVQK